jgi:putative phosphoribosyl transferase
VVFANGSGSSRHSPRNRYVSDALNAASMGTLLFDQLTPQEERHWTHVFDVGLLAGRLAVTDWLRGSPR